MVRLPMQVKACSKSARSCFSYYCCDALCFRCFEHHKANLIKHDLGRVKRLFSGQFELKNKGVYGN